MNKTIWIFYLLIIVHQGVVRAQNVENLLLKDYRPVSAFRIPQVEVKKARYPVVDAHSHDYAKSKEEVDEWVNTMDSVGIAFTHIMSCNWIGEPIDVFMERYRDYPDRFGFWCSFDYTGFDEPDWEKRAIASLVHYHKLGVIGVGEMGDKGEGDLYGYPVEGRGIHIDHPQLKPLLEKCASLGMPVNIHVGEPIWMYLPIDANNDGLMNSANWRIDTTKTNCLGYDGLMLHFENALKANPKTTFIACHYLNMNHDLPRLGRLLDQYPNLYLDISARVSESAATPRATREFIIRYADRILFGTDNGRRAQMYQSVFRILESNDEHIITPGNSHYWPLSGFGLPDDVLKKIYRSNAEKLFKIKSL